MLQCSLISPFNFFNLTDLYNKSNCSGETKDGYISDSLPVSCTDSQINYLQLSNNDYNINYRG